MSPKRPVSGQTDSASRSPIDRELFDNNALLDTVIGQFVTVAPRLKPGELASWAGDLRASHEPTIRRMFFGTIEWPRAAGRPNTPTQSAAFAIVHAWPEAFLEYQGGDAAAWRLIESPYPVQPTLVDGPSDEQTLRVSYCGVIGTRPIEHPIQQLRIRGIDGTDWVAPDGRQIGSVRPKPVLWTLDRANPVQFLPPFVLSID